MFHEFDLAAGDDVGEGFLNDVREEDQCPGARLGEAGLPQAGVDLGARHRQLLVQRAEDESLGVRDPALTVQVA
ncbi:hypothetical protein [Couchioplanes caeruleus]|uniref:hypothetical protein n=1 Tax=Couchioplanes caeruleus TaxID=56438 RepID=UPI000AFF0645|nr:hypothetical protein [Couchioplanes caeruleus]